MTRTLLKTVAPAAVVGVVAGLLTHGYAAANAPEAWAWLLAPVLGIAAGAVAFYVTAALLTALVVANHFEDFDT